MLNLHNNILNDNTAILGGQFPDFNIALLSHIWRNYDVKTSNIDQPCRYIGDTALYIGDTKLR